MPKSFSPLFVGSMGETLLICQDAQECKSFQSPFRRVDG